MKNHFKQYYYSLLISTIVFLYSVPICGINNPIYIPSDEPYLIENDVTVYYHRSLVQSVAITDYQPALLEVPQKKEFYFDISITKSDKVEDVIKAFMRQIEKSRNEPNNVRLLNNWFTQEMKNQGATTTTSNKLCPFPIKRLFTKTSSPDDPPVFVLVEQDKLVNIKPSQCWDHIKSLGKTAIDYLYQCCYNSTLRQKLPSKWLYWGGQMQKLWNKAGLNFCKKKVTPDDVDLLSMKDPITTKFKKIVIPYNAKVKKGGKYDIYTIGQGQLSKKCNITPPTAVYVKELSAYQELSFCQKVPSYGKISSYKDSFKGLCGAFN